MKRIILIIGVSGCGKSTIGKLLSEKTNIPFFDGDDFHPEDNIRKMSSGNALNDDDRKGWLIALNTLAKHHTEKEGAIIACSALKESYRQLLSNTISKQIKWVFLKGNKNLILHRMSSRSDHFMPSDLLESQFETLEVPDYGLHLDIENTPETLVKTIQKQLHL